MIVYENVTKQFGDNPPSVVDINIQVEPGEFIFLTGHSGSGKTTLLKLLTKEYLITDGEIQFDGQPLSKLKSGKLHHHRRKIGVIYQDYRLLPELNVWENIALALEIIGKPQREIEERVTDLLELVQLTDKAFFFPAELSGGESQRVGIARALATAPNVLLADEPTGNLDPENSLMIARLFSKIHELGTTVLFATHDLAVLDHLGHRRITLEKGRIIKDSGAKKTASAAQKNVAPKSEQSKEYHSEKKKPAEVQAPKAKEATEDTPPEKKRTFGFSLFGKKKDQPQETAQDKSKPLEKKPETSAPSVDIMIEEL